MTEIIRQSLDHDPVFDEIEWEKPQSKQYAGELLIVGGSPHGFASIGNSYNYAEVAGAGRITVIMPSATKSVVEGMIENVNYLPSTISGSFSKKGLSELKGYASNSWATLLAGDFGRNSETSLLVEGLLVSHTGKIIVSKDAVDFAATSYPRQVLDNQQVVLVCSLSQLQKLLQAIGVENNLTFNMHMEQITVFLQTLSQQFSAKIITVHHAHCFVAVDGQVSITPLGFAEGLWQTKVAAYASVYWMQHDTKTFKALTVAVHAALRREV